MLYAVISYICCLLAAEANDVLYGGDETFKKEQQAIIDRLLELILEQMAALKANPGVRIYPILLRHTYADFFSQRMNVSKSSWPVRYSSTQRALLLSTTSRLLYLATCSIWLKNVVPPIRS